MKNARRIR